MKAPIKKNYTQKSSYYDRHNLFAGGNILFLNFSVSSVTDRAAGLKSANIDFSTNSTPGQDILY